jgi:hypothetical protein
MSCWTTSPFTPPTTSRNLELAPSRVWNVRSVLGKTDGRHHRAPASIPTGVHFANRLGHHGRRASRHRPSHPHRRDPPDRRPCQARLAAPKSTQGALPRQLLLRRCRPTRPTSAHTDSPTALSRIDRSVGHRDLPRKRRALHRVRTPNILRTPHRHTRRRHRPHLHPLRRTQRSRLTTLTAAQADPTPTKLRKSRVCRHRLTERSSDGEIRIETGVLVPKRMVIGQYAFGGLIPVGC